MAQPKQETSMQWSKLKNINSACLLGNDVIAFGYGSVIQFTTLATGIDTYYRTNNKKNGDGMNCLASHKTMLLFAFGEMVIQPRIFVLEYPSFKNVSVLQNPTSSYYRQIAFTQTELLIALTGMPDFTIQVFSWRADSLLVSIKTDFISDSQIFRVDFSGTLIGQFGTLLPKLYVWEIHGAINQSKLLRRRIKLPEHSKNAPFAFSFFTDGTIMFMNCHGTIYNIHMTTNHSIKIIENDENIIAKYPYIHVFKGGLLISVGDCTLKYYKKVEGVWQLIASSTFDNILVTLKTHANESVVGVTQMGAILKFTLNNNSFDCKFIRMYSRAFKSFVFVNPLREFVVTLTSFDALSIFFKQTGKKISSINVPNSTVMCEHPIYPYILVGDTFGLVHLVSCYQPGLIQIITSFHLCSYEILNIKFTKMGNIFVVHDSIGNFFFISATIGTKMEILKFIPIKENILDMVINEDNENIYVYALRQTAEKSIILCGDAIIRIVLDKLMDFKVNTIYLKELYVQINSYLDTMDCILAIPLRSIEIHVCEVFISLKTNKPDIKINHKLQTLHKLLYFHLCTQGTHLLTYGMDGLVTAIDLIEKKNVFCFVAHHRLTVGCVLADIDLNMEYVLSLGFSGNIVCTKILHATVDTALIRSYRMVLRSPAVLNMFKNETIGFVPTDSDADKSWLDLKHDENLKKEIKQYAFERQNIKNDFEKLKAQINILVNQNEEAPENEKLPLQAFNVDNDMVDSIKEIARKDRENEDKIMRNYCKVQGEIVAWLLNNCWDKMEVHGAKIRGIFVKMCTENYALLKSNKEWEDNLKSVALWRSTESIVATNDKFRPWRPLEIKELEDILSREPKLDEPGEMEHDSFYSNEHEGDTEDNEDNKRKKIEALKYTLSGTNTHKYIEPYMWRIEQFEVVSYSQMYMENIMGMSDMLGLREYFNKQFLKLQNDKELEIHLTSQRNERLRYIQNELNTLTKLKNSEEFLEDEIVDPEYMPDEKPESIVIVEDWEVPITPYISPSRQKILDEIAAEAERRRLEMLADDFRERALMTMMDGVLEIRWEDEIKKNPPLPECLASQKDPKDYDEADLKAILQYEQNMKFLNSERDRYRVMLEQEQIKLSHTLDDQILKFNYKVGELLLNKMKIEFAIDCEKMKLLKYSYYNIRRINCRRSEMTLKEEIRLLKNDIETLMVDLQEFEEKCVESLNIYDSAVARDRMLDKQFKLSFSEHASPAITDLAFKFFKRRAKWQMRSWATPSILLDMANRVITNKTTDNEKPVPHECIAYLELLEKNDNYALAPNTMDHYTWEILCKMRRVKVESEFKVRSYGVQHAETEAATNFYMKEISQNQQHLNNLQRKLDDLRNSNLENSLNRFVQIVMKRGLVEIPISGRVSDFDDAILIHVSDVDDINKIIKKAGKKKIKAMENAAVFRRKIIYKEWEHLVLRTTVRDMKNMVSVIDKFQITKEVQLWLKRKKHGWHEDISQTALNRDIATTINSYEKMLNEIIQNTDDLEKRIEVKKKENKILDKKIQAINIDITELNFERDFPMEERELRGRSERMTILVERSKLVRLVQQQHAQILEYSTMLELQKLRTFPTLNINCDNY